jgi:hypothetical protein
MKQLLALLPLLAATTSWAIPEPNGLSPAMRAPSGESAAFVLAAEGMQIYTCKPKAGDATAFQWTFVAPEATLRDGGRTVGHHGAGPVWESDSDRSSVKGSVVQKQDGGSGNIPWLLLKGAPSEGGGVFAGVTSIQRVNTKGGVEPSTGCDASHSGEESRVPYTADYYFYKNSNAVTGA